MGELDVSDMEELPEPPNLRFLRMLVTVLTAVMIGGLIAVVALLVTRLPGRAVTVPAALAIPGGIEVHAVTQTQAYWLVTTKDERLLVFEVDGTLVRDIPLLP